MYSDDIWHEIDRLLVIGNATIHPKSDWDKISRDQRKKMLLDVD